MFQATKRRLAALAAGLILAIGAGAEAHAQVVIAPDAIAPPSRAARVFLRDVIDVHAHLDPDSFGPHSAQAARALDVFDMARRAQRAGMRGFVIKQHYDQTAQLAYLVTKQFPDIEAFGMLAMNLTVGGLNPEAVHHFAEVKGGRARIVSMPTWDSANNVRHSQNPTRPSVAVSRGGALTPEARAVIEAVAGATVRDSGAKLVLATGHIAPEEVLLVVREAKRAGIERILVTHAIGHPIEMNIAQMQEAAGLGATIEFVAAFIIGSRASFTAQQYADAIRAIGPANIVLSSDSGQLNRPSPDDTLALVAAQLHEKGITSAELRQMMVDNPAALLGVAPAR